MVLPENPTHRPGPARDGFPTACWWLSRQVEFLQWRLHLESAMASRELQPIVLPVREGEGNAVHSL